MHMEYAHPYAWVNAAKFLNAATTMIVAIITKSEVREENS
jgi:hypothetical protein